MASSFDDFFQPMPAFYKVRHQNYLISHFSGQNTEYGVFKRGAEHRSFKPRPEKSERLYLTNLSGGCIYFPWNSRFKVLKLLACDIKADSPYNSWNQIGYADQGMRFVVDIDCPSHVLSDAEVCDLIYMLGYTLYVYFRDSSIRMFTSMNKLKLKKRTHCCGVHIVCHVAVSMEQALQLTHSYATHIKASRKWKPGVIDVDASIYRKSANYVNLRTIYSRKVEKCIQCNNHVNNKEFCGASNQFCLGQGRVFTEGVYVPIACTSLDVQCSEACFNETHSSYFSMVKHHNVWPVASTELRYNYKKPHSEPVYTVLTQTVSQLKKRRGPSVPSSSLIVSDYQVHKIEQFIRSIHVDGKAPWKDIFVRKVDRRTRNLYIDVSGPNSTNCVQSDKVHSSNRIYFIMSSTGKLYQKCHSVLKVSQGKRLKASPCCVMPFKTYTIPRQLLNDCFAPKSTELKSSKKVKR